MVNINAFSQLEKMDMRFRNYENGRNEGMSEYNKFFTQMQLQIIHQAGLSRVLITYTVPFVALIPSGVRIFELLTKTSSSLT